MSGINNISNTSMDSYLASGKSINSAADNAAGLAIVENMKSQTGALDAGTRNAASGQDMIQVASGSLDSITDSLQRIRELSLQASNSAIYSAEDISAMQDEVNQLLQGIDDVAKNTQFNRQNILDGSRADYDLATNPNGHGMKLQMSSATLSELGIAGYDLTGNFDMSAIDRALEKVGSAKSSLGAQSNDLQRQINYNDYASYNTTSAQSKLEDLDYGKAVSEDKKNEVLEQYKLMMQKKQEEQNANQTRNILGLQ